MKGTSGSFMTTSLGERHWLGRILTGQCWTAGSTMRHSLGARGQSRGALNPTGAVAVTAPSTLTQYPVQGTQICRNYNEGRCRKLQCRYQHLCLSCNESHPYMSCPRRRLPTKLPRARSPGRRRGPRLH